MKADAAFGNFANDITPALLAIGRPAFPQALMSALRRVADVGHCMVFSFAGERSTACLLDAGNIPIGGDLGVAYSEHFHQSDPNRDAIFGGQGESAPVLYRERERLGPPWTKDHRIALAATIVGGG